MRIDQRQRSRRWSREFVEVYLQLPSVELIPRSRVNDPMRLVNVGGKRPA